MAKQNDGGIAFPLSREAEGWYQPGMSLLDYFAGQALVALGNWVPQGHGMHGWLPPERLKQLRAEWAYEQAAAMLKARERAAG
jgi:hypothetical protein